MLTLERLSPGSRVRITQAIDKRAEVWAAPIEGTLLEVLRAPTGSWYAQGKDDRYWLQRVRIRKDNGEESLLSLDQNSLIEVLSGPG
jgi:hypothetical protein